MYRRYGLPYQSPTVGLYFFAEDYLMFLENLEESLHSEIKITDARDSKYFSILQKKGQGEVLVGLINCEIEVIFLHYKTEEEVYEKWMRRSKRLNFQNLIVKFSEMNLCETSHLERFEHLPYKKKVLFLAKPHNEIDIGVVVDRYTKNDEVNNDTLYYDGFIDIENLINEIP